MTYFSWNTTSLLLTAPDPQSEFKMTSAEAIVTSASGRASSVPGEAPSPPDVRLLHYNDVYHLDPSSSEPVGGAARFLTLCKEYREAAPFQGQPELVTLFSGDVFNPSLESSVTKGLSISTADAHHSTSISYQYHRQTHGFHPEPDRDRLRLCRGMPVPPLTYPDRSRWPETTNSHLLLVAEPRSRLRGYAVSLPDLQM